MLFPLGVKELCNQGVKTNAFSFEKLRCYEVKRKFCVIRYITFIVPFRKIQ